MDPIGSINIKKDSTFAMLLTAQARGNLAAGGRGEGVPLSERDRWIAGDLMNAIQGKLQQ
ncbi:hypothetical protein DJ030_11110 [bacterium endosymbiont of Escarpia laminata]|nr:MAG: hypothetical protein DJ031_11180 [bacterium endosymbiont of Escarpia laminata]RLJ18592.1 MAG: hypothetical protein DJ030_11110 [bacterium endosymbiont of Escarpia laminata]